MINLNYLMAVTQGQIFKVRSSTSQKEMKHNPLNTLILLFIFTSIGLIID